MTRAAARLLSVPTALVLALSATPALAARARAAAPKPPSHPGRQHGSGAATDPSMEIASLSCPTTGECTAVGTFNDALGDRQGVLLNEHGGRWRRSVLARPPAGAAVNPFKNSDGGEILDVDCPAAGTCVAVGRYTDAHGIDHGVIFSERHDRWARGLRVRLPRNAIRPARPKNGATEDVHIAAVTCTSPGNCTVVGRYETTAEVWEGLIVTQSGGHWARGIEAPLPAGAPIEGQSTFLLSVVCDGPGSCTVSGDYVDPKGHQQALLLQGGGAHWAAVPAPAAPADANVDPNVEPASLACTDFFTCTAVGTYTNPLDNSLALLLSETRGVWAAGTGVALPAGAAPASTVGDQTAVLSSVSCPRAGACTAVGWYFDNYENGQGLLLDQRDSAWQPAGRATLPANAIGGLEKQSSGLDWVSCASAGNCLATGVYTDIGLNSQGLLVSEVNGAWQPALEAPLPRDAGRQQTAATNQSDCTGPGDCTVIGEYYDTAGNLRGYTLGESGGVWGRPRAVPLPAPTAAELRLSLDALLTPYGASGALAQVRRNDGFTFRYPGVEPGVASVAWYASAGGVRTLIGDGSVRLRHAGVVKLKLTLNARGAALLAAHSGVSVSAVASFAPQEHRGRSRSATAQFVLR